MSASNQFDWVDFYKELSDRLLQYKANREELIKKVKRIYEITRIRIPALEKDNQIVDIVCQIPKDEVEKCVPENLNS